MCVLLHRNDHMPTLLRILSYAPLHPQQHTMCCAASHSSDSQITDDGPKINSDACICACFFARFATYLFRVSFCVCAVLFFLYPFSVGCGGFNSVFFVFFFFLSLGLHMRLGFAGVCVCARAWKWIWRVKQERKKK